MIEKKDHEVAVDAFVEADRAYREFQEKVLDGTLAVELASTHQTDALKSAWQAAMQHLQNLLEERNSRCIDAANAMRQAVQLAPTQWRGPEGKPTKITYGPAEVSSVTSRRFDPESLISLASQKGFLERLLQSECVKQVWSVDYEATLRFLRSSNHEDIITGAYDEFEKTPQVKGIKPLAFLGDEAKK